jgi:hypothetical protein
MSDVISKVMSAGLDGFRAAKTYVRPPVVSTVAVCSPCGTRYCARNTGWLGEAAMD